MQETSSFSSNSKDRYFDNHVRIYNKGNARIACQYNVMVDNGPTEIQGGVGPSLFVRYFLQFGGYQQMLKNNNNEKIGLANI